MIIRAVVLLTGAGGTALRGCGCGWYGHVMGLQVGRTMFRTAPHTCRSYHPAMVRGAEALCDRVAECMAATTGRSGSSSGAEVAGW